MDEIKAKLEQAQSLLSEVYAYACDNGLDELENKMSMADTMIVEGLDTIPNLKKYRVTIRYTQVMHIDLETETPMEALAVAQSLDPTHHFTVQEKMIDSYFVTHLTGV